MDMVSMSPQCKFNSETPKGFIFSCFGGSMQLSRFFPHTAEHRKTNHVQNSDPQWVSWELWTTLATVAAGTVLDHGAGHMDITGFICQFSLQWGIFYLGWELVCIIWGLGFTLNGQPLFSRPLKNSSNTYSLQRGYNDLQFKNWIHRSCFVVVTVLR